jgi:hypothetical protein
VFAFQGPENIRLDIIPINSAFTIQSGACFEGNAILLYPSEKRSVTGPTASILSTFFSGLPIQANFLLGVLTGRLPDSLANQTSWEGYKDTSDALTLISTDHSQAWYFTDQKELSRIEVRDTTLGKIRAVLSFGPPIDCGGYRFPSTITGEFPTERTTIVLRHSSPQCDQAINPSIFTLSIPSDFEQATQ